MTHRASVATATSRPALTALFLLCISHLAWGQLRVEAQLSSQALPSPRPVELRLTAIATGENVVAPDLDVLEPDFQVLDRRVERRVSVTNGKRQEELRLRLLLLPRRTGELDLPAIPFGSGRTRPLHLSVKGESADSASSSKADPGYSVPMFEPSAAAVPGPYGPDWGSGFLSGSLPGISPLQPQNGGPSIDTSPALGPERVATAPTPKESGSSESSSGIFGDPWFWVSVVLAISLAVTLRRRRDQGHSPRTELGSGADGVQPPPDPLKGAVDAVRAAYQRGDGTGAREALLDWGRLRWSQDPPGNLARLARRCPAPLRDHITELEEAFFSPDPIHWELRPVAEELLALSPSGDPPAERPTTDAAPSAFG